MLRSFKKNGFAALMLAGLAFAALPMVSKPVLAQGILPEALTQFTDANGAPLAAGSVAFYIPNTLTPKTTWADSGLTVQNTNPVQLNAAGRASIWGSGSYRQIVKDVNGNTIWDQVTSAAATLSSMPNGTVASNLSGVPAAAAANTVTSVLDVIGNVQGSVMYRGATSWILLPPGTNGQLLTSGGPAANPSWSSGQNLPSLYSGLVVQTTSNTAVVINANALSLNNGTTYKSIFSSSFPINISTTSTGANGLDIGTIAANTFYSVWAIYNPTTQTVAGLLSLQSSANATFLSHLPTGYTYYLRVGWVYETAGPVLARTIQHGNRAQYTVVTSTGTAAYPVMATGIAGSGSTTTTPTWAAVATSAYIPSTASAITIGSLPVGAVIVSPNNQVGGTGGQNYPIYSVSAQGYGSATTMELEGSSIYWVSANASNALLCYGWVDNL